MKKRFLALALSLVISAGSLAALPVSADSNVKPTSVKAKKATVTVYKGSEFDLNVKMSPADAEDDYLRWSIVGKKGIIKFADDDKTDDEVEFKAVKKGTTKVKCYIKGTKKATYITVKVKNPTYKFSRVGKASRTVNAGKEFELEVKKSGGLKDNHLKWSIKDTSIVKFAEKDITDDDIELKALKAGKTTVSCYNKKTKKTIKYTITVKGSSSSSSLSRVGKETKTVEVDDDIELKVKQSGTASKYYKWTIEDTSILRFEDNDNAGKEVEVEGRKVGTTKVTCTNTKTNKSVSYTIKVVPEVDD